MEIKAEEMHMRVQSSERFVDEAVSAAERYHVVKGAVALGEPTIGEPRILMPDAAHFAIDGLERDNHPPLIISAAGWRRRRRLCI